MSLLDVSFSRAADDPEWDAFVASAPGGHHVQSSLWGQVKASLGWKAARVVVRRSDTIVAGCQLLVRPLPKVGTLAYAPRGPLARRDDPEALASTLAAVPDLARSERVRYLKVQPPVDRADLEPVLEQRGYAASDMEAAPTATVVVELDREPEQLLQAMRSTTRTKIRKAARNGVEVRVGGPDDFETFGQLVQATSERQGFLPYPVSYYRRMWEVFRPGGHARLLLAEHEGTAVSGILLVGYGDTAVYKMGAWSGQRSSVRPTELTHYLAMQWARERGHRYYDFDGIPDEAAEAVLRGGPPAGEQKGLTHYKLGFGGQVRVYPRAHDTSPSPLLAPAVRALAPRANSIRAVADRVLGRG